MGQNMGYVELRLGEYCLFYFAKSAVSFLFENLWYHRVVSGFFTPNRHQDILEGFFDVEAGKQFDHRRRESLGSLPINMFCYIKHDTSYIKHPTSKKLRRKVLEYYGYKCHYCGAELTEKSSDTSIHHLIPERYEGKTDLENLRPVCLSCHKSLHRAEYWTKGRALGREYWMKTKPACAIEK